MRLVLVSVHEMAPQEPPRALCIFKDPDGLPGEADWFVSDRHVIAFFKANVGATFEVPLPNPPKVT